MQHSQHAYIRKPIYGSKLLAVLFVFISGIVPHIEQTGDSQTVTLVLQGAQAFLEFLYTKTLLTNSISTVLVILLFD